MARLKVSCEAPRSRTYRAHAHTAEFTVKANRVETVVRSPVLVATLHQFIERVCRFDREINGGREPCYDRERRASASETVPSPRAR